jgi:hypothetical protein
MRTLLADDLLGISERGQRYSKIEILAEIANGRGSTVSSEVTRADVRFFGETAVSQGQEHDVFKPGMAVDLAWSDIWVKRGGTWQIIAAQDTVVKSAQ